MRSFDRLWLAVGLVILLGVGVVAGIASDVIKLGDRDKPAPSAPVTSEPKPSQSATEMVAQDFIKIYHQYLVVATTVRQQGGKDPDRLDAVAGGDELERLKQEATQWREQGWRLQGSPTIVYIGRPMEGTADGTKSVQLVTCEDYKNSVMVDRGGKPQRDPKAPTLVASTSLLQQRDGRWLVVNIDAQPAKSCEPDPSVVSRSGSAVPSRSTSASPSISSSVKQ